MEANQSPSDLLGRQAHQPSMAIGAIIDNATVLHVDGAHGLVIALPDHERGYVNVRSNYIKRCVKTPTS